MTKLLKTMIKYEKLPDVIKVRGIGIPNLTMKLIKENGKVRLYERDDKIFEVGIIKETKASMLFDKQYPDREQIWNSEDFGATALTTKDRDRALGLFDMFVKRESNKQDSIDDDKSNKVQGSKS